MILDHPMLRDKKHIHMIGIGGSGMYPLAQILHGQGYYLTGSDNNPTDTVEKVRQMGIPVFLGQRAENIEGADLIVHTAAIMADNEELIAAKQSGVPVLERSDLLGIVTGCFDNAICVSGTHGKTTTSAMLTQIMMSAQKDPTVAIGGKLQVIDGSGRIGTTPHMVCEACEFVDTFLKLSPDIALVLNIDEDHMDYFKTMDRMIESFRRFCTMATNCVIYNGDDANTCRAVAGLSNRMVTFGLQPTNDYYPQNVQKHSGIHWSFDLMRRGELLCTLQLHVPGEHNVGNAVAACACALESGVTPEQLQLGMDAFHGVGRRFEVLGTPQGITVADDYAHHPAELAVTLQAAKQMGFARVIAVHQPFTYSRTARLLDDFAEVLQLADHAVLSEIMGSREKNTIGIYAKDLADKIPGCRWFATFEEITDYVCDMARPGDLILTLGCGDVNTCAHQMVERLQSME